MADVFQIVTDRIISELEKGYIPWHKPWCNVETGAFNRITHRQYSLLNQLMLRHAGEYASFHQWTSLGGKIRKGEKAETVVFWKWPEATEKVESDTVNEGEDTRSDIKDHPVLKYYSVFHISQVDGVEPLQRGSVHYSHEPIEDADRLFREYTQREGIRVQEEESNDAYYSPGLDMIHVPSRQQYEHLEEFYSTVLHEAVHSTGHSCRLSRFKKGRVSFGSETYSKEELVAEIGSAAILNMLDIETDVSIKNSIAYIQNWLSVLRGDKRLIVHAASQAEKAIHFIMKDYDS